MATTGSSIPTQKETRGAFSRLATRCSAVVGSPSGFALAAASILIWGVLGPHYHYSDTWQLVMNSFTDIFTFLIVFLIQHTQLRHSRAIHLKLDEIIRAQSYAENELINIEKVSDEELDALERHYARIREEVRLRKERENIEGDKGSMNQI